jgi:hypothetical protein
MPFINPAKLHAEMSTHKLCMQQRILVQKSGRAEAACITKCPEQSQHSAKIF